MRITFSILLAGVPFILYSQKLDTAIVHQRMNKLKDSVYHYKSYKAYVEFDSLQKLYFKKKFKEEAHQLEDSLEHYNFAMRYVTNDTSIYGEMQEAWIAQQGINYASPLNLIGPIGPRRISLRDGEGDRGYILEANLDHRFIIGMGRPSADAVRRRMRYTFDYRGNFRMSFDSSAPIMPWTNEVGLGYEWIFWNSYNNSKRNRYDQTTLAKYKKATGKNELKFFTLSTQIHHYSNGQPDSSFYSPDNGVTQRNDYARGNFSTNFIRVKVIRSIIGIDQYKLGNIGLGLRWDPGINYAKELEQSYGKLRAEFLLDKYTRVTGKDSMHLKQFHYRLEGDLILDDVSKFDANLRNSNRDFRFGVHGYAELRPLNHRAIGYFAHAYFGRDYMNIRYDDIVWMIQFGFTFSPHKFYPSGWKATNTDGFKLKRRTLERTGGIIQQIFKR